MSLGTWQRPTQTVTPDQIEQITIPKPVLYRCYGALDTLLYIGMSRRPDRRFKQHRSSSEWWQYVERIDLASYKNQKSLQQAERKAIRIERPQFNKLGRIGDFPCLPTNQYRTSTLLSGDALRFGNWLEED